MIRRNRFDVIEYLSKKKACRYHTDLEKRYYIGHPIGWTVVSKESCSICRRFVYLFSRHLKFEAGYDRPCYGEYGADYDPFHLAFLIDAPSHSLDPKYGGFVLFRQRTTMLDTPLYWEMCGAWLHPFLRDTGLLTRAWPFFREKFGDFAVDQPGLAMRGLLKKLSHDPSIPDSSQRARDKHLLWRDDTELEKDSK